MGRLQSPTVICFTDSSGTVIGRGRSCACRLADLGEEFWLRTVKCGRMPAVRDGLVTAMLNESIGWFEFYEC